MRNNLIYNHPDLDENFKLVKIRGFIDPPTFPFFEYPEYPSPMEYDNKSQNWKIWVGIALAGAVAAGIGTYMFNKNRKQI